MIRIFSFHNGARGHNPLTGLLLFLAVVLTSCSINQAKMPTTPQMNVPSTDFVFHPIDSYQVSESDGMIRMYKPGDKRSPTFLIWGRTFSGYVSRETWVDGRYDELHFKDPQEIEINGISGYITKYEEGENGEDLVSWMAILATEKEGMVLLANSSLDERASTETLLRTILDSVSVQEKSK